MNMALIKLNFSRLPVPEKIALARRIAAAMTGNSHFTTRPHHQLYRASSTRLRI